MLFLIIKTMVFDQVIFSQTSSLSDTPVESIVHTEVIGELVKGQNVFIHSRDL